MLNIFYGDMKEAVYNTAAYFKYDYEDNWITDPFVKKMIKDCGSVDCFGQWSNRQPSVRKKYRLRGYQVVLKH